MPITAKQFLSGATAEQEAQFFASIRLANGTFKTTSDRRFDDLNALVLKEWLRRGFRPDRLMDVGASSGISTMEWLNALQAVGLKPLIVATDISISAEIVRVCPGWDILTDRSGIILQHMLLGLAVRPWRRRLDYLTGYAALSPVLNALAIARRAQWRMIGGLALISMRTENQSGLMWSEEDVLSRAQDGECVDAIRAANILNRNYFSPEQLHVAVLNLKARLVDGGHLIVSRTMPNGENNGTLYCLDEDRNFRAIAHLRQGSEIDDIIQDTRKM